MEEFTQLIGKPGVLVVIGMLFFFGAYKNSVQLFKWIEDQTMGTRDYILQKFELMFIEVNPDHVTYVLVGISFGFGLFIFAIFAVFGKFLPGSILGAMFTFIGWKLPRPIVDSMLEKRVKAFQGQMVDALNLLSNGLRAGLSLPQAVGMVVAELPAPVSQEFNLILQQNKIGVPLDECFENMKKRMPTQDNEMFVTGISILRETGGNLAETFDTIAYIIRERVRLQQKIDTITAQGRFQAYVMAAMPFVLAGVFASGNPASMLPLVTTPLGIILTIVALGLDFLGLYIILKIVTIKM